MNQQLRREIGLVGLTLIAAGSCIGSGIFIVPSDVAALLESPGRIFGVWLLGGIVAITGALTFAELAARFPGAGGVYVYLREAYGHLTAFLYGWVTLTVITSGAIAALSLTFARYLSFLVPMTQTGLVITGAAAIISATLINVLGVRFGDLFASVTTAIKLAGILSILVIGIFLGSSVEVVGEAAVPTTEPVGIGAYALAMIGVLWSFGGWHHASYLSAETRNPRRVVPRAMMAGALIVTITYLVANWAYMRLLPIAAIAESKAVASDAVQAVFPSGAIGVTILIAISTLGSLGIFTLSAPRIYYAMAKDGRFFAFLSRLHPKHGTPHTAILLQSAWALVILVFWGHFEKIISSVVFMDWVFMILAMAAIFVIRKRVGKSGDYYKVPLYPVVPLIFIVISLWFVAYTLIGRPYQAIAAIVLLVIGIPVYFMNLPRKPKSGS